MPKARRDLSADVERYFRTDSGVAHSIAKTIGQIAGELKAKKGMERIRIMNFCGTHEWTTTHYGIRSLLPDNVEMISGPGCPVCVTPANYVDTCIKLALEGVRVYSYGDAFRLPNTRAVSNARSLEEAKALGGDVKVVYSFLDAMRDAREHGKDCVFLGIGFETTTPGYSEPLAHDLVPENLYFLSALRLTPPAASFALEKVGGVDGIIAPGHVSVVTGASAWAPIAERFKTPAVVSGFEPLDLLISVAGLLNQISRGEHKVEIEYSRAVGWEGNQRVMASISKVFREADAAWRGIGVIPASGLEPRREYSRFDAKERFGVRDPTREACMEDLPEGCRCGEVTLGLIRPTDCPLFLAACTAEKPYGPCMVSSEGTCAVWARYGGGGLADRVARETKVSP
ncbi:MAG TPA: hydrogenase formation protein HypD [Conexivisphaerales archaeon]|nr:hydrogenase formation protein HypD [Conexivisphaerales archaeon]